MRVLPLIVGPQKKRRQEEKEEIEALRKRFLPPDGEYGWVIAFAAFLVQFWVAGLIKSYGVIYMEVSSRSDCS